MENSLNALQRAGSITNRDMNVSMFPFDAFEFDDPNRTANPSLTMKYPWQFKIGDSKIPWEAKQHGIIPFNGWFASFIDLSTTTLESESSTAVVTPSDENLNTSAYGVNGYVEFSLASFPVSFANYTIIFRHSGAWEYLTSGGINNSKHISVSGGVVKLWSNFNYVLPFTLSYTSESFREILFIPESYSQLAIEQIINNADTFMNYFTDSAANPSLTLSPQGLLWKSGDSYIRLGSTASFHGVDLDSGNFKAGEQGWQITKEGDVEFNDGTFRGTLDAVDGTFTGDLTVTSDEAERQISVGSKGLLVKDSYNNIIHNLPAMADTSKLEYFGHYYATPTGGSLTTGTLTKHSTDTFSGWSASLSTNLTSYLFFSGLPTDANVKAGRFKFETHTVIGAKYANKDSYVRVRFYAYYKSSASASLVEYDYSTYIDYDHHSSTTTTELIIPISYDNKVYWKYNVYMDGLNTANAYSTVSISSELKGLYL